MQQQRDIGDFIAALVEGRPVTPETQEEVDALTLLQPVIEANNRYIATLPESVREIESLTHIMYPVTEPQLSLQSRIRKLSEEEYDRDFISEPRSREASDRVKAYFTLTTPGWLPELEFEETFARVLRHALQTQRPLCNHLTRDLPTIVNHMQVFSYDLIEEYFRAIGGCYWRHENELAEALSDVLFQIDEMSDGCDAFQLLKSRSHLLYRRLNRFRDLDPAERVELLPFEQTDELVKNERDLREAVDVTRKLQLIVPQVEELLRNLYNPRPQPPPLSLQPPRGQFPGGEEYRQTSATFAGRGLEDVKRRIAALTVESPEKELVDLLTTLSIAGDFTVPEAVSYLKQYATQL